MLDMGFVKPVRRIVAALHPRRQSALFSATMPAEVAELAQEFLKDPVRVEVTPQATTVERIEQRAELVPTSEKRARLAELVSATGRTIVFARTKRGADRVAENLMKDGIPAEVIHGNKAQNARQRALNLFRTGQVRVLVATDIVARGIDVPGISHIVNYDLPDEPENYVHRIGRTGRAGAAGAALSLVDREEMRLLTSIERLIRRPIERIQTEGFVAPPKSANDADGNRPPRGGRPGGGRPGNGARQGAPRGGRPGGAPAGARRQGQGAGGRGRGGNGARSGNR